MTFSFPTKTRRNAQRKNGGSNAQCGRFVPKDAAEPANADSADAAASTSLSLSELFDEDLLLLSDDGPEKHAKREWRQCLGNTDVSRRDDPIAPPTPTTPADGQDSADAANTHAADTADTAVPASPGLSDLVDEDLLLLSDDDPEQRAEGK